MVHLFFCLFGSVFCLMVTLATGVGVENVALNYWIGGFCGILISALLQAFSHMGSGAQVAR